MRRRRTLIAFVTCTALLSPVAVAALAGTASAQYVFDAVAAADGTVTTVANPSLPIGLVAQASGPTTQARLTSLPTSDAFASFPYPGETVVGLPGIVGSVLGVPLPGYPLIVSSGLGDEPRRRSAPGIDLLATSLQDAAESTATVGSTASGAESTSRVVTDPEDGVTASAETTGRGLELLGGVTVDGVRSTVTVHRDGAGALTTRSSLSIARITVPALVMTVPAQVPIFGGQAVTAPDIGFVDGQFLLSLPFAGAPQRIPVPADDVLKALGAAGITAHFQRPARTRDGIVGASLDLVAILPAPPENPGYNGPTRVTYSLGRVSASVSLTQVEQAAPPGVAGSSAVTPDLPTGQLATAPVLSADGPLAAGALAGHPPAAPALIPGLSSFTHRLPLDAELADIYLLLVTLGGIGFLSLHAIRLLGVRHA